jgi:hypothetical protein
VARVAHMGNIRNAYKTFDVEPKSKRCLRIFRHRLGFKIKIGVKFTGLNFID